MTIKDGILAIMALYGIEILTMKGERGMTEKTADQILSLIQSEIREAMNEEWDQHTNELRANLVKRGLLKEEA